MSGRNITLYVLKLAVSLAVLTLLFYSVNIHTLIEHSRGVSLVALLVASGCYIVATFISTIRWSMLLLSQGIDVPLRNLFAYNLSYTFYSVALPGGKVAAEGIRLYQLTRDNGIAGEKFKVVLPTLIDRSSVLIVSLVSSMLFFIFIPSVAATQFPPWLPVVGLISVLIVIMTVIFPIEKFFETKEQRKEQKKSLLGTYVEGIRSYRNRIPLLIGAVVLTLFMNILITAGLVLVSLSLSVHVTYLQMFFIYAVGMVSAFLPLSFGGIGIREGVFAYLLTTMTGSSVEASVSVSLMALVATLAVVLAGGVVEFRRHFLLVSYL